jgi:hypothetical protein
MNKETQEMILYGLLREGLLFSLMRNATVSWALSYKELCMAAKNEERRLKKKQEYEKGVRSTASAHILLSPALKLDKPIKRQLGLRKFGHIEHECRAKKGESQVLLKQTASQLDPLNYLLSDSDKESVTVVSRVPFKRSQP